MGRRWRDSFRVPVVEEREREVGTRKDRRENTRSTQDHKNLFGLPFREPTCLSILRRDAF